MFECVPGLTSVYTLNVQKDSKAGYLLLVVIQNGNLLDALNTQAAYKHLVYEAGEELDKEDKREKLTAS